MQGEAVFVILSILTVVVVISRTISGFMADRADPAPAVGERYGALCSKVAAAVIARVASTELFLPALHCPASG